MAIGEGAEGCLVDLQRRKGGFDEVEKSMQRDTLVRGWHEEDSMARGPWCFRGRCCEGLGL